MGKDLELSNQELIETIQGAVLNTPTAFNSQTSRVVILLDEESDAFWNEIAYSELEEVTPAEAFEATKERLAGFAQAKGTILFYEDQDVVKGLQEQFPLYAENFPIWSEQGHGIAINIQNGSPCTFSSGKNPFLIVPTTMSTIVGSSSTVINLIPFDSAKTFVPS